MAEPGVAFGYAEAVLYGLIQGVTEFLPISSSGHLALAHRWELAVLPEELKLPFDVLLHAATLVAILIALRRDVWELCRWQPRRWGLILVAALPAGLFGLFGGDLIAGLRDELWAIALCYLLTALLLVVSERLAVAHERAGGDLVAGFERLTWRQAGIVGLFQLPTPLAGISRSGATLAGGLVVRLRTDFAIRFAFLVGIPLIAGAAAKDAIDGGFADLVTTVGLAPLALAFAVALLSGIAAIALLRLLAAQRRLVWFAGYCLVVAVICLWFEFGG